jgi:hypothetical protein
LEQDSNLEKPAEGEGANPNLQDMDTREDSKVPESDGENLTRSRQGEEGEIPENPEELPPYVHMQRRTKHKDLQDLSMYPTTCSTFYGHVLTHNDDTPYVAKLLLVLVEQSLPDFQADIAATTLVGMVVEQGGLAFLSEMGTDIEPCLSDLLQTWKAELLAQAPEHGQTEEEIKVLDNIGTLWTDALLEKPAPPAAALLEKTATSTPVA